MWPRRRELAKCRIEPGLSETGVPITSQAVLFYTWRLE
jgi:hypothetical protein